MTLSELVPWGRSRSIPIRRHDDYPPSLFSLQEEMNRLMEEFLGDDNGGAFGKAPKMPAVDLIENGKDLKVKVELAGMDPEDITVELSGDVLTLSGERREENEEEKEEEGYLRREISYGSFKRSIPLPQSADTEQADATFKNGILTIAIPKKEDAQHQTRKLEIKKTA